MNVAETSFADERRIGVILIQYWNALRGDDEFPTEEQIDPDKLIGIWERCFMVQMRDIEKVKHFNYSYFGSDLSQAYVDGRLEPGNFNIVAPDASDLAKKYEEVTLERGPIMDEGEYKDSRDRTVLYRQIFMPLGNEDGEIDAILGGSWFRFG